MAFVSKSDLIEKVRPLLERLDQLKDEAESIVDPLDDAIREIGDALDDAEE